MTDPRSLEMRYVRPCSRYANHMEATSLKKLHLVEQEIPQRKVDRRHVCNPDQDRARFTMLILWCEYVRPKTKYPKKGSMGLL